MWLRVRLLAGVALWVLAAVLVAHGGALPVVLGVVAFLAGLALLLSVPRGGRSSSSGAYGDSGGGHHFDTSGGWGDGGAGGGGGDGGGGG